MEHFANFNLSSFLSDSFIETLFEKCIDQLSAITEICFLLCGLFAFGYFANILMKTWAKGEPIEFLPLLKPFIIGIITLNFSVVYNTVDGLFEPINIYTENISQHDNTEYQKKAQELSNIKKTYQLAEKKKKSESGFWKGIFGINSSSSFFENLYINVMDLLLNAVEYIAAIAFGAVKLIIRAINVAFRIVLIVFGPFAFTLSIIPIFKKNWIGWISKYINVCLFIPIANLMDVIIQQLNATLMQQHINIYHDALEQLSYDVTSLDSSLTTITISYIIFLLTFIVLYLMIPSIASYIVSASGMESLTGGITLAGSAAMGKLISNSTANPLIPNILQLFTRHHWKNKIIQWIGEKESSSTNHIIIQQQMNPKQSC